jgi:hypothetical protein
LPVQEPVREERPVTRVKAVDFKPLLDMNLNVEMKSLMEEFIKVIGNTPRNVPLGKIKIAFGKALTYYIG